MSGDAGLGGLDRRLQGLVASGRPAASAARSNAARHCPADRRRQRAPGEQPTSGGPGIGAGPGEVEARRAAPPRLRRGPARATLAAAARSARRWRQTPNQGGLLRTKESRRASAAPARKAASASLSGGFSARAQAGNGAGRGRRNAWISANQRESSMAEG